MSIHLLELTLTTGKSVLFEDFFLAGNHLYIDMKASVKGLVAAVVQKNPKVVDHSRESR